MAKPNATYEMVIRTAMSRGTTIPKGRVNMPREAKPKREDKILVFADGKLAQEAREAGAHIVGGEELIEGVCCISPPFHLHLQPSLSGYQWQISSHHSTMQLRSYSYYHTQTGSYLGSQRSHALGATWNCHRQHRRVHQEALEQH